MSIASPPLIKGAVYQFMTGPAEYVGIDVYYGEVTHKFKDERGFRYIRQEHVANAVAGIRKDET